MIEKLQTRTFTPAQFFISACDEKFTDEDLNEEGNAFAHDYFDLSTGKYLADYEKTLGANLDDLYRVADTWENFEILKPVIDRRFQQWKATRGTEL